MKRVDVLEYYHKYVNSAPNFTYDSTIVPVYYVLADPANVSLLMSPADVADGCTMYQEIWIS